MFKVFNLIYIILYCNFNTYEFLKYIIGLISIIITTYELIGKQNLKIVCLT